MKRTRKHYDKEFKEMAVNLVFSGKSSSEVAEDLGIRTELVNRWKREYEQHGTSSFSGKGNMNVTAEQKEIIRLKKELKDAQIERDILKKAISIFSKGDSKYTGS
jgi:transposase